VPVERWVAKLGEKAVDLLGLAFRLLLKSTVFQENLEHTFKMNPDLPKIILAIVSEVVRRGSYVTKTKLLKLLYLFDVEYFRAHREIFTGLSWRYHHLGPWAPEYDEVLQTLKCQGVLTEFQTRNPENETSLYRVTPPVEIFGLLKGSQDEGILRVVLNAWADRGTAEILDYVYFQTEPMEQGERYKPLDFTVIPEQVPMKYIRSSSGKTLDEIRLLKKEFKQRVTPTSEIETPLTITPPDYDDAFFDFLRELETMD
jgi:hypothetical protein